jgi:plasmid stabilization system protein ParE
MTTEVEFLAGARTDFDSAFDWYSARGESAAKRSVEEVQAPLDRIALDPEMFAHLDDVFRQARMKRFPDRTHRRAAQGFRFRGRIDLLAGPPGLSFQRLSAKGRRPALKQGRIAGSDSPKPLFF